MLYQEVPRLFRQQDLRGLVGKTTAQQPKVQQFESTGFQQAAAAATAETSGIQ